MNPPRSLRAVPLRPIVTYLLALIATSITGRTAFLILQIRQEILIICFHVLTLYTANPFRTSQKIEEFLPSDTHNCALKVPGVTILGVLLFQELYLVVSVGKISVR